MLSSCISNLTIPTHFVIPYINKQVADLPFGLAALPSCFGYSIQQHVMPSI